MADTSDFSHLITEEPTHDAEVAPTSRTNGPSGRKKKDDDGGSEEKLPEPVDREELEEFRAFKAAQAAASGEPQDEVLRVIELDGEQYRIAEIDDDVMGHIQAVLMFTASDSNSADNRQDLGQLAGVLEALMEPGEWDRLRVHALEYVKELRLRAHQAKAEGRDDDPESYSIVALLKSILEGIMSEFQETTANPKR